MAEGVKQKKKTSGFMIFVKVMAMLVLLAYIIFAFVQEGSWQNTASCQKLEICIKDSACAAFVSKEEVLDMLNRKKLNPVHHPMDKIQLHVIESELAKHPFILEVQCYKMTNNIVRIDIDQHLPVMRVISKTGENYYIDARGNVMNQNGHVADVVIATGYISHKYAHKVLGRLGQEVQQDQFWNSQVEQFNVLRDGTIEMVPRVGNHIVYFGKPSQMELKLSHLKDFYTKVLSKVGWNKYKRIDLQYVNQVIGIKSEEI